MTITKSLAVVFVGAGLTASLLLLGQTWADTGNTTGKISTISFIDDGTTLYQDGAQAPYV